MILFRSTVEYELSYAFSHPQCRSESPFLPDFAHAKHSHAASIYSANWCEDECQDCGLFGRLSGIRTALVSRDDNNSPPVIAQRGIAPVAIGTAPLEQWTGPGQC